MWTGDRIRVSKGCAGFTLVEAIIVCATIGTLSLLVERTVAAIRDADETLSTFSRVQERCDKTAYQMYEMVRSSRRLFFRGTTDEGYLQALDVRRHLPAPGTRLPLPDEVDPLGPDLDGEPRTGNALLFVREGDPVACAVGAPSTEVRYIDVYRFTCFYPHEGNRRVLVRSGRDSRDLIVWESIPFASHAQILAIPAGTQRTNVIKALHGQGVTYAWDGNAAATAAFYPLGASGTIAATPEVDYVIEEDLAVSPGSVLLYANFQLARSTDDSFDRRALLSVEPEDEWVPDGFEVKVVGASGARRVWINLVVEAQSVTQREAVAKATLVVNLRDL
jgi:hypothetical protein